MQKNNNLKGINDNLNCQDLLCIKHLINEYQSSTNKFIFQKEELTKENAKLRTERDEANKMLNKLKQQYNLLDKKNVKLKQKHDTLKQKYDVLNKENTKLKDQYDATNKENTKLRSERDSSNILLNEFKQRYDALDKEYKNFLTKQTNKTNKTNKANKTNKTNNNNYNNCVENQTNINHPIYKYVSKTYINANDLTTKISPNIAESYMDLTRLLMAKDNIIEDKTKPACEGKDKCVGTCSLGDYCLSNRRLESNFMEKFKKGPSFLDKYITDIFVSLYKTIDPSKQSLWNTDAKRSTFLVKATSDGISDWNLDKCALPI